MTATAHIAEATPPNPHQNAPEHGVIGVHGVTLSEVNYWRENGQHVFVSTEFDIWAADEDMQAAIDKFVDNAEDYWDMMADLVIDESAADMEAESAIALGRRLVDAYQAQLDGLRRRARVLSMLSRRRRVLSRGGYHSSGPKISLPQ